MLQSDEQEEDIDEELKLPDSDEYSDEADFDRDNEQEIVILTEKKLQDLYHGHHLKENILSCNLLRKNRNLYL